LHVLAPHAELSRTFVRRFRTGACGVDSGGDTDDHEQRGAWEVASFLGTQIEQESHATLRELAAETGAPTLAAHVLDSDTAIIDGYSAQYGH
jgi:hypothetical protein